MSCNKETVCIECCGDATKTLEKIQKALKKRPDFFELKKDNELINSYEALEGINTMEDNDLKSHLDIVIKSHYSHRKNYWLDDEVPLGQIEGKEWALRSKDHIQTYCEVLETMDLNHEVYQGRDIKEVVAKWANEPEVLELIATYATLPSQFGRDDTCMLLSLAGFFEENKVHTRLLAKYLVNGHSYHSYICKDFKNNNHFETPIWDYRILTDLAKKLSQTQQISIDTYVRNSFKQLHKKGYDPDFKRPALWHQIQLLLEPNS